MRVEIQICMLDQLERRSWRADAPWMRPEHERACAEPLFRVARHRTLRANIGIHVLEVQSKVTL